MNGESLKYVDISGGIENTHIISVRVRIFWVNLSVFLDRDLFGLYFYPLLIPLSLSLATFIPSILRS